MRRGAGNIIFQSLGGPNSGQKGSILFLDYFFGGGDAAKLRWREGAQRPVWRNNEPKKTGARSARARTRGHNPLVNDICLLFYMLFMFQMYTRARIFKLLRSPGIDSASLCSLAGWYGNPIPIGP